MKLSVFGESPADEGTVRILVEAILGRPTEPISLPLESRGWPFLRNNLSKVIRHLMFSTETEALVVVTDADSSPIHHQDHEQAGSRYADCRLCCLRDIVECEQKQLSSDSLKIAIGLAVPSIEAWYLCGTDTRGSEAAWLQTEERKRNTMYRNRLKYAVYQTERPTLELEKRYATAAAQRLAQDISLLETHFPKGFGPLIKTIRTW